MGYGGKLMPRYHNVDNQKIQYTEAEELARDAEEQQWIDEAPAREAKKKVYGCALTFPTNNLLNVYAFCWTGGGKFSIL